MQHVQHELRKNVSFNIQPPKKYHSLSCSGYSVVAASINWRDPVPFCLIDKIKNDEARQEQRQRHLNEKSGGWGFFFLLKKKKSQTLVLSRRFSMYIRRSASRSCGCSAIVLSKLYFSARKVFVFILHLQVDIKLRAVSEDLWLSPRKSLNIWTWSDKEKKNQSGCKSTAVTFENRRGRSRSDIGAIGNSSFAPGGSASIEGSVCSIIPCTSATVTATALLFFVFFFDKFKRGNFKKITAAVERHNCRRHPGPTYKEEIFRLIFRFIFLVCFGRRPLTFGGLRPPSKKWALSFFSSFSSSSSLLSPLFGFQKQWFSLPPVPFSLRSHLLFSLLPKERNLATPVFSCPFFLLLIIHKGPKQTFASARLQ